MIGLDKEFLLSMLGNRDFEMFGVIFSNWNLSVSDARVLSLPWVLETFEQDWRYFLVGLCGFSA